MPQLTEQLQLKRSFSNYFYKVEEASKLLAGTEISFREKSSLVFHERPSEPLEEMESKPSLFSYQYAEKAVSSTPPLVIEGNYNNDTQQWIQNNSWSWDSYTTTLCNYDTVVWVHIYEDTCGRPDYLDSRSFTDDIEKTDYTPWH